jgi:cytochrome c peroxidase
MYDILKSRSVLWACVIGEAVCFPTTKTKAEPLSLAAIANSISGATPAPPRWLPSTLHQALKIPAAKTAPSLPGTQPPRQIPRSEEDSDPSGLLGSYQPGGPTTTVANAFFRPLGTNGRTCFSCHQPASGMSISLGALQQIFAANPGDPVFAAIDGADCPNQPSSHEILLNKGLFRIFLPVPANAQYTLTVQSDPNGCNTLPAYAQSVDPTTGQTVQMVSVYRRPRPATNLKFVTVTEANPNGAIPGYPSLCSDLVTRAPQPTDPFTGLCESGNIMWDGREPTLQSQATDAVLVHAQATAAPTATELAQIVAFETGIYSAQVYDDGAGSLNGDGASGGPVRLSQQEAGVFPPPNPDFNLYNAWSGATKHAALLQLTSLQESIYRGMSLFSTLDVHVPNVAGLSNANGGVELITCASCHNQTNVGSALNVGAQYDIGIGGGSSSLGGPAPATDLPIFQLTCNNGASTPYDGTVVVTNDPGKALIPGLCADMGRRTVPQLRGLAARAPYFSDGSASTLTAVVEFYNTRFNIGLTSQQEADLVNFLNAL